MRRPALALVVAALAGGSVLACSSEDGRSLPPVRVPQTTTTPSAPVIQPSAGNVEVFTLSSPTFADGEPLPVQLTCEGEDVSPALSWTGTPLDASSLAVVVRDLNAGGYVHWIVTHIDPFVHGVGQGGLPENAIEGLNSSGSVGWLGPCLQSQTGVHTFEFALLALPDLVDLPLDTPAAEAAAALDAAASERAVLTGTVTAG